MRRHTVGPTSRNSTRICREPSETVDVTTVSGQERAVCRDWASHGGAGRHAETPAVLTNAERGGCSPEGGGTALETPVGFPGAARVGGSAKARLLRSRQSSRSLALASRYVMAGRFHLRSIVLSTDVWSHTV